MGLIEKVSCVGADEMNLRDPMTWLHMYSVIRSDLGFSEGRDCAAATLLDTVLSTQQEGNIEELLESLRSILQGASVLVVGAGPSCTKCREIYKSYDVVICADGATRCCIHSGVKPDIVVTDLDGVAGFEELLRYTIVVAHAHGDNMRLLTMSLPLILKVSKGVIGTSQCLVSNRVRIFGGFTDGDRAAYLASYFDARRIGLVGFDFGGIVGQYSKPRMIHEMHASPLKLRKLKWARILLAYLRSWRGEGFIRWEY